MSATRFASFRPLRHRNFALVWFGGMVSNIGSWMQTLAVSVLVTQLTHQAHWTGLVAAAAFLPMGLLTPVGGAMADPRLDMFRDFVNSLEVDPGAGGESSPGGGGRPH